MIRCTPVVRCFCGRPSKFFVGGFQLGEMQHPQCNKGSNFGDHNAAADVVLDPAVHHCHNVSRWTAAQSRWVRNPRRALFANLAHDVGNSCAMPDAESHTTTTPVDGNQGQAPRPGTGRGIALYRTLGLRSLDRNGRV